MGCDEGFGLNYSLVIASDGSFILLGWGMGRAAAWRMAIRRPKEYRSKVDAAMRCRGACSH